MKRSCPVLLLLMLAFSSWAAHAAEVTGPPPLSLHDLIAVAQKNEIDILVGQNSVTSAKASVTQANSAYYPQAAVVYNLFSVNNNNNIATPVDQTGGTLTITQNFYDGGLREANVRGAKASLKQSGYALSRTRQQVTYTVTSDYFALLRAQKSVETDLAQEKYLEDQLTSVQARVDAGDAAAVDILPIQAQLANAKVTTLSDQNAVKTAAINLQQAMGLTPQAVFAVQDFPDLAPVQLGPMDTYLATAYASRPDIPESKFGVNAAKATVDSSKIVLYPRPVVTGEVQQPLSGSQSTFSTMTGGINYALFDGGSNLAAYRTAKANLSTAKEQAAQLNKTIQADVQNAYLNLTNAQARLTASGVSLDSAQKNYDAQNARYAQGLATPLDLLNAEQQLVAAQTALVQARYDYYTALAQLEFATGKQGEFYGS